MSKANFFEIYAHDSADEAMSAEMARQFKQAAESALEESGHILLFMKSFNPEINIPWHYRAAKEQKADAGRRPDAHR